MKYLFLMPLIMMLSVLMPNSIYAFGGGHGGRGGHMGGGYMGGGAGGIGGYHGGGYGGNGGYRGGYGGRRFYGGGRVLALGAVAVGSGLFLLNDSYYSCDPDSQYYYPDYCD